MTSQLAKCFVLLVFLANPTLKQVYSADLSDVNDLISSQEHIKHAEMYYWLARARNNSQVEVDEAIKHFKWAGSDLNKAEEILNQKDDPSITNGSLVELGTLRKKIEQGLRRSRKQLYVGNNFLENYSTILRFMLGKDDIIVRYDLDGNLAYIKAIEKLLPSHPILWQGTLYLIVCSKNADEDQSASELIHAYLNTHTNHYIIPEYEIAGLWNEGLLGKSFENNLDKETRDAANSLLNKICNQYGCDGVGILQHEILDECENVTFACVRFKYWDNNSKLFNKSFYAQGFTEKRTPWPLLAYLLPLFGFPVTWIYIQRAKKYKGSAPPLWAGTVAAVFSIVILMSANFGLGKFAPDLNTIILSPTGILWILITSLVYSLLPVVVTYPVLGVVPVIGRAHSRPDTISSLFFGSFLGSISLLLFLSWTRTGLRSDVLAVVAGSIVLTAFICHRIGYSFSSWLLSRHTNGLSETIGFLVLLLVLMAVPLTMKLVFLSIALSAVMVVSFGLPWVLDKVNKPRNSIQNTSELSSIVTLSDRIREPHYVELPELTELIDNCIQFLSNSDTSQTSCLSVIYIEGETGCGKTRFSKEMANRLLSKIGEEKKFVVLYGGNEESERLSSKTPYPPFSQALSGVLGVNRLADPDSNLRKLRSLASKTGLTGLGAIGMGAMATLLDVAGLGGETPRKGTEDEIARVVSQTLVSLAENSYLLFIVDDCQWLDQGTSRLLRKVIVDLYERPKAVDIGFVITSQPKETNTVLDLLTDLKNSNVIRLLSDNSTFNAIEKRGNLTSELLSSLRFDYKSRTALLRHFNECGCARPLNILQTVRLLIQRDWIEAAGKEYILSNNVDFADLSICDEYHKLLDKHFSGLPSSLTDVLHCCAIVGNQFNVSIISQIFSIDVLLMLKQLKEAEELRLIQDVTEIDDVYEFCEKRTAWYFRSKDVKQSGERNLYQLAREYHKRYVQVLEKTHGIKDNILKDVSLVILKELAVHTEKTIDTWPNKAFIYNYHAGRRCYQIGFYEDAIHFYSSVQGVVEHKNNKLDKNDVVTYCVEYLKCLLEAEADPNGRQWCLRMLNRQTEEGGFSNDDVKIYEEYLILEVLDIFKSGDIKLAHEKTTSILAMKNTQVRTRLYAHFYSAVTQSRDGEEAVKKAILAHEDVITEVSSILEDNDPSNEDRSELATIISSAYNNMGFMFLHSLGEPEKAINAFNKALLTIEQKDQNNYKGKAIASGGLGDCYLALENIEKAENYYNDNYMISIKHGDLQGICRMSSMLGKVYLVKSQETEDKTERETFINKARANFEESLQVALRQENTISVLFALAGLVDSAVEQLDEEQVEYECVRLNQIIDVIAEFKQIRIDDGVDALAQSADKAIEAFDNCEKSLESVFERLSEMKTAKRII